MADLVALAEELVQDYLAQAQRLAAAGRVARNWGAGTLSSQEAEVALACLGYDTHREQWPYFFAGLLAVIADECFASLPVAQRATELARALDAGLLPEVATALRPARPAGDFMAGLAATAEEEELTNRLCTAISGG